MRSSIIAAVLLSNAAARADEIHAAVAVNPPVRWGDKEAIGGSAYVGLTGHDALKLNVATWHYYGSSMPVPITPAQFEGDSPFVQRGRVTDVGVSYVYFPRRLWSGGFLEGGLVGRHQRIDVVDAESFPEQSTLGSSNTLAARGMMGWSWLFGGHVFVSAQVGLAVGYETGSKTDNVAMDGPTPARSTPSDINQIDATFEAMMRIGVGF